MVPATERAATEKVWHKGGWAVDSPPPVRASQCYQPSAQVSPVTTRGGWPAAGAYSRDTGSWYTGEAPPAAEKGSYPAYAWQQQKFLRAMA